MRLMQSGISVAVAASLLALGACNPATDAGPKSPAAVTVNFT